jgi:hypothetical protein
MFFFPDQSVKNFNRTCIYFWIKIQPISTLRMVGRPIKEQVRAYMYMYSGVFEDNLPTPYRQCLLARILNYYPYTQTYKESCVR